MRTAKHTFASVNPVRWLGRLASRLHADERGNLGILLLLTVWALVGLIGMVWNSGEFATRRRLIQTAADSAAHAGNLWVGRTTNLTAATNMLMSENGSAEVILRAVPPTAQTIQQRFDSERKRALQLRDGDTAGKPELGIPDAEYFEELLGLASFAGAGRAEQRLADLRALAPDILQAMKRVLPLVPGPQAARLQQEIPENLRRNDVALRWLTGTWVGGADPAVPAQPGPPAPGGVRGTVSDWIEGQVRPRLEDILQTLDEEQTWLDRWTTQTAPAVNSKTPDELRDARAEIFDYQKQIRDRTPQVVDDQRQALAAFYKCDLTIATPGHPSTPELPADVQAPVEPAGDVQSKTQVDTIRQRYPQAALARFGTADPSVTIDPINVNVRNAVIWHPGGSAAAPGGIVLYGETYQGQFHVNGGDWGKVPCAPLSRYFNDRVSRDTQGLRTEPQGIDRVRSDLRARIHPPPAQPSLAALPTTIADEKTGAADIPIAPERIPNLPVPDALTDAEKADLRALNTRISKYNSDVRSYVNELRNVLQPALDRMYQNLSSLTDISSTTFADATWLQHVEEMRALVLMEMGDDKTFMVLKPYALRPIPEWARQGMHDDVRQYVYRAVYDRNIGQVTQDVRSRVEAWATGVIQAQAAQGGQGGGRNAARQQARQFANSVASGVAQNVVDQVARQVAADVSDEWVQRPWPFEIDPPDQAAPPHRGLTDAERKETFSFLAAAKTTADSAPRVFFSRIFTPTDKPLVAFAQGETFNWMEFDGDYGAGDAYDRVSDYGHGDMGGSPRPWRVSTIGGWTWQPRLAQSDALGQAMEDGPEFRSFLEQGGVTGDDPDAIKNLALH